MSGAPNGKRVVILGAGVSGLTTAWKLAERGVPVTVVEKDDTVGGLARTVRRGGAGFDFGPHQLYTQFDDVVEEWKDLLGEDLISCTKEARVRFWGKVLRYPLSTGDILHQIPLWLSVKCFADFAWTHLKNSFRSREARSFEDWVVHRFGHTLYRIHFGPYTEKVWGIPPSRLTADAAEKRIAVQSLWQVFLKTFFKGEARYRIRTKIHHSPYQTQFRYPRQGLDQLVHKLRERVLAAGGIVLTSTPVLGVDLGASRVRVGGADGERTLPYDELVSTVPINAFPKLCEPAPPAELLRTADQLRFRAMCFLNLTVKKPQVTPAHWIYFPEPHLSFQRSAEYSNFTRKNAPDGKASFSLEVPCFVGDERWNASDEAIFREAMAGMADIGLLTEDEVDDYFVARTGHAYPLFEIESQRQADEILRHFAEHHPRVHFTGRQARFSYINIDHCMHFANEVVERILAAPK